MSIEKSIEIRESKKREMYILEEERKQILNSLNTRESRYYLKNNTRKLAMNTGFSIIEVEAIYR